MRSLAVRAGIGLAQQAVIMWLVVFASAGSSWTIDRFACHPDHARYSDQPCRADVALSHLAEPLPSGSWWTGTPVQPDQRELVKLGYGYYRHVGQSGSYENPERRAIARFHIVDRDASQGVYSYAATARDGRPLQVCEQDSGGPGMQVRADGIDVVGVTSQFTAQADSDICGPTGSDTTLAVFDSWLENSRAALLAGRTVESSCP
jgi:hypothetical protein